MQLRSGLAFILFLTAPQIQAQSLWADSTQNINSAFLNLRTMDVQSADLNGDGHKDIVLAIEFFGNRVLFNDGNGHFQDVSQGKFSTAHHDSEDITIADLDGNGWPDIVFAAEDDTTHELYLNAGNGDFTEVSERLPHFESNAVVSTDINNDGHTDLLFGNNGQSRIFINDGMANFTDETVNRFPVLHKVTQDLLLVDVNGDGHKDIVMGNEDGNCLLINNGSGIFTDETLQRLPQGIDMETRKVSTADVNGDGFPDLFCANVAFIPGKDLQDRLYLNDGTGNFSDATATHFPAQLRHTVDAAFLDLNNDGHPDLITGHMGNLLPGVYLNNGNGVFTDETLQLMTPGTNGNNIAIHPGDFNGDGLTDLYIGGFNTPDRLLIRLAEPTTSFTAEKQNNGIRVIPNPACGSITITGMNDDIKVTISIINMGGQKVREYKDVYLQKDKKAIVLPLILADGNYLLTAIAAGGTIFSDKITVSCNR